VVWDLRERERGKQFSLPGSLNHRVAESSQQLCRAPHTRTPNHKKEIGEAVEAYVRESFAEARRTWRRLAYSTVHTM